MEMNMLNVDNILLRHNYISMPASGNDTVSEEVVATIVMNLAYYGKALNVEAYRKLTKAYSSNMVDWWVTIEKELKDITGANRKIGDFVVYKNFPAEVLNKTEADYWIPQIMMYWGFPKEMFTEEVKPREKMTEEKKPTVLKLAKVNSLKDIFNSLLAAPARWKKEELADVILLSESQEINFAKLTFKENLISLASHLMQSGREVNLNTGTDVLRLAAGLSGGDVSLREKTKFKSFKKPERRFLLGILNRCANLEEDVARRPELWKRLLHQLHPGDFKRQFPHVCDVQDSLYKDTLTTFNSKVEELLLDKSPKVLPLLATRPGEFRRRLVHTLDIFGTKAVKAFTAKEVLDKLTTAQVVGLRSYLETVNERFHRIFPPKGNWTKAQIGEARWVDEKHVKSISKALGKVLAARVHPVKVLDEATKMVKLPSNDGEVSPYNRGTVFQIPEDVDFIRTASYWQNTKEGVTWFDNGWNFFDQNWKSLGACCWSANSFPLPEHWNKKVSEAGAVFSGDPINTAEMKGRAAQLIDLYPKKLKAQGVKYAVWNILCYSRLAFSQVEEVFAALQWGKGAQEGNLFEPSRCQLALPLKGDSMTKYVCVIDLDTMEMIYIDANLHGNVTSAANNGKHLEKNMPPFMEYIKSLPSVYDLFCESVDKNSNGPQILYSDKNAELKGGSAYVFKPENKESKYKSVDINSLLS
jgi:hypothetical protein